MPGGVDPPAGRAPGPTAPGFRFGATAAARGALARVAPPAAGARLEGKGRVDTAKTLMLRFTSSGPETDAEGTVAPGAVAKG